VSSEYKERVVGIPLILGPAVTVQPLTEARVLATPFATPVILS
jgi:hypothetical protein